MFRALGIVVILSIFSLTRGFPQEIRKCKKSDETCIIERANQLMKNFDVQKKLGLPEVDPMLIKNMDINQGGNSSVKINLKFKNCHLIGLSNGVFDKFTGFQEDPDKNKLEIRMKTPLGVLQGPYQINGQLLVLPIQGNGNVTLRLENLDVTLKCLTKKVVKDGKSYMNVDKSKFNYEISGSRINFSNLFNGDKVLGDNINLFLNENSKMILQELHKPITNAFAEALKNLLNAVLGKTPYDELFEN